MIRRVLPCPRTCFYQPIRPHESLHCVTLGFCPSSRIRSSHDKPSVMAGMANFAGHRICSLRREKVPKLRINRAESLVSTTRERVGCEHTSGLAAVLSASEQSRSEAGEHPVCAWPLSHKMTGILLPNVNRPSGRSSVGARPTGPSGFPGTNSSDLPGPGFGPRPDCSTPRAA